MKPTALEGVINFFWKPAFLLFVLWFQGGETTIAVDHPWTWMLVGIVGEEELSPLWGDPVARGVKPQTHTSVRCRMNRKQSNEEGSSILCVGAVVWSLWQKIKRRDIPQIWDIKIEIFPKSAEQLPLPLPAWQRWYGGTGSLWVCGFVCVWPTSYKKSVTMSLVSGRFLLLCCLDIH